MIATAQIDVVHARGINPSAIEHCVDDMRGQHRGFGVVERPTIGFANPRTGGGDNSGFTHGNILL
mgnify:CR=1 FL=1